MALPLLAGTSGAHQAQVGACGHQGPGVHRGTVGPPSHHGWLAPSARCQGDPVGSNGCAHVVIPLLSATSRVHQAQMAACGHQGAGGGAEALLGLVGPMGGWPQAPGARETQWGLMGVPM